MEHAQRVEVYPYENDIYVGVLILILMEHAQRDIVKILKKKDVISLNPYFNGTCSKSKKAHVVP